MPAQPTEALRLLCTPPPQAGFPGQDVDGNCQQTLFKYLPTLSGRGAHIPMPKTGQIQVNSNGKNNLGPSTPFPGHSVYSGLTAGRKEKKA